MEKRHILVVGERHAGKTTLTEKLLGYITKPIYGYFTRSDATDGEGFHRIYIYSAAKNAKHENTEKNRIGTCNGKKREVNIDVFETLGVEYLKNKPDGIIVMDEIGFMESGAPKFKSAVRSCLDNDTHVLAMVRAKAGVDFLDEIRTHPKAEVYELNGENGDEIFAKLLPQIIKWNSEE